MDTNTVQESLLKGINSSKKENWFTKATGKISGAATNWTINRVAESVGKTLANQPEIITDQMREVTEAHLDEEGLQTDTSAKDIIFKAAAINPEKDGLWTRIKKRFFSMALSFGTFATAYIGVNYTNKHWDTNIDKDGRSWLQKLLAIFSSETLFPEMFPVTA